MNYPPISANYSALYPSYPNNLSAAPSNIYAHQNKPAQNLQYMLPIQENKQSNTALNVTLGAIFVVSAIGLIFDVMSLCRGGKTSSNSLRKLAQQRVSNNVVKRNNLTLDRLTQDMNNIASKNKLANGDALCLIKTSAAPKSAGFSNLGLNKDSIAIANKNGEIYKILDTKSLDKEIELLFGNQPQCRVTI